MAVFSKSQVPQFSVDVYQNEYLPEGGREVNAIVTVTSTGGGTTRGVPLLGATSAASEVPGPAAPSAGVVIMVDCSGSMDYPPTKMRNARDATAAAVDTLRDGVAFAVIAGTHNATEVYPGGGGLAVADPATRAQAKDALRRLSAGGGTAIGTWLRLADRLLASADLSIRHGILLTDGRNEHETPEDLRAALDACAGRFTCDARGVGTDWEVKEVTGIASALLGTADIVADPSGLAADFTQMMENAMGKEVADVALRLWTPVSVEIAFVKQVAPTVEELTGRRTEAGPRAGDYPTGSWGDESRDYHVCVKVPEAGIGREMLAARVSLIVPAADGGAPEVLANGLVRAVWTDDMAASTSINPQVAHYTGQAELAQVIQQGLEARKSGDFDGATAKLGRAVQLAAHSGNEDTAKLLSKVVDVVDVATGTVRLKAKVAEADEMTLETRSTKTVRVKESAARAVAQAEMNRPAGRRRRGGRADMPTCPNGHQSGSDDWCEVCGHRMAGHGAPSGAVPPPPPPPPSYGYPGPGGDPNATAQAELCPQCRTPREAMAPFCEECRYNFLTHTATSYTPLAPPPQPGPNLPPGFQSQPGQPAPPAQQGPPPQQHRDPFEYQSSRPSQMNRPAEPLGQEPPQAYQQGGPPPPQAYQQGGPPPQAYQQGGPPPQAYQQGGPPPPPPAFQQPGPPPPPSYQQSAPPAPPQPQHTGGGDDWMLSPPSRTQSPPPPAAPQGPQGPQSPAPFQQQPPPPQHGQQHGGPQGGPHGGPPPQFAGRSTWTAVIGPDREYFLAMMQRSGPEATGLNLPAYSPEQQLPLTGNQVSIGRRRHSTGESPDIDLSVPPEDPGVSHQHAVLVQQPDGSWAVVDQNSTNGTTVNGAEDPIQPYVPIPLNDGDRVHVGAWTTITVRRG